MHFQTYCFVLCIFFNLLNKINAYSGGPPLSQIICETLRPLGHMGKSSQNSLLNFEVTSSKDWFVPNEIIQSKYNI